MRKIIQILHHSLSQEMVSAPRYSYEEGWHIRLTREILQRNRDYQIECWRPEKTLRQPHAYNLEGIPCRLFPSLAPKPLGAQEWSYSLIRELRRERQKGPLLVHLHGIYNPLAYSIALSLPHTPKLAQGHGEIPNLFGFQQLLKRKDAKALGYLLLFLLDFFPQRIALGKIDHFFVLNSLDRAYFSRFVGQEKVEIQTMGIDFGRFQRKDKLEARKGFDLVPDGKYVLYVGALHRRKGLDYLLSAFLEVLKAYPESILIVGGEGKERGPLEELSRRLGIYQKVKFLGWVEQSKLPYLYSAADVCVLPSFYEGLGITVVEALACETPFIGTRVGGIPDVVKNFQGGLLVPPRDSQELAGAIIHCLGSSGDFTVNRREGEKCYSWDSIVKNTLKMYNELSCRYYGVRHEGLTG